MSDKASQSSSATKAQDRKEYQKLAILHEVALETRAGSPLSNPDGILDLTGTGDQ